MPYSVFKNDESLAFLSGFHYPVSEYGGTRGELKVSENHVFLTKIWRKSRFFSTTKERKCHNF